MWLAKQNVNLQTSQEGESMSGRPKKYPDILYGCWGGEKKDILTLFNQKVADALVTVGINIVIYDRRQPPQPAPTPAVPPKEPDKPPWKCLTGDWTGDNPPKRLAGKDKGKFCCPECGAEVVKNE